MARPLLPPPVLAAFDARLLARLLGPHRAFLEARRLALGDDTPAWRARLAEALTDGGAELPAALQYAFLAIGDLASPEGEGALRALAADRGVDVATAPGRPADAALWAYLEQRALFRDAHARFAALAAGTLAAQGALGAGHQASTGRRGGPTPGVGRQRGALSLLSAYRPRGTRLRAPLVVRGRVGACLDGDEKRDARVVAPRLQRAAGLGVVLLEAGEGAAPSTSKRYSLPFGIGRRVSLRCSGLNRGREEHRSHHVNSASTRPCLLAPRLLRQCG